ncbi:uncharacterized protein MKS88_000308 [Plasmodium brasilianum]|uniref:uncharacterized protein n=1 Tax=Plasmodium brasilianum TaxID=5824 RepID=UPI00350E358C|nr:hypothetical protein MKS88_000308 [Plasmodium brasilianum]
MDIMKESLNTSMKTFISIFSGTDLKEYKYEGNLEYKSKKNKIYNEFNSLYKIIQNNVKSTSGNSKNYIEVNKLKEEAQNEETKLRNKEEETKYLNDIIKKEALRLMLHIKKEVQKLVGLAHEYSEVNNYHESIKKLVVDIKLLYEESNILSKIKQAVYRNKSIQNEMHKSFKNKAKNMFAHYSYIIKYSNVIDKKQKENEKIIKDLSDINLNIEAMNELNNKMNNTKNKKSSVLSEMKDIFKKYNTLNSIMFNNEGYNHILEKSKYEHLKELCEAFSQKKISTVDAIKMNKIKSDFDNYIVSLDKLEKQVEKINVKENSGETKQREKSSVDGIYKNI